MGTSDTKRIWVKVTAETHVKLKHLAIDLGKRSIEVFAGELLAEFIDRKSADAPKLPQKKAR